MIEINGAIIYVHAYFSFSVFYFAFVMIWVEVVVALLLPLYAYLYKSILTWLSILLCWPSFCVLYITFICTYILTTIYMYTNCIATSHLYNGTSLNKNNLGKLSDSVEHIFWYVLVVDFKFSFSLCSAIATEVCT